MESIHESISSSFLPPNGFGDSILTDWTCTCASATYAGEDYCTYNCAPACSWAEVMAWPSLWISPEIKGYCSLSCVYTLCVEAASFSLLCLSVWNAASSCSILSRALFRVFCHGGISPSSSSWFIIKSGILRTFKQSFAGSSRKFQNIHCTVAGLLCNGKSPIGSYNSTSEGPKLQNKHHKRAKNLKTWGFPIFSKV